MRVCSGCGISGHNIKTCPNKNFQEGDIVLKSKLKSFFKGVEHKRWNKGGWITHPATDKLKDNKYTITEIIENDKVKIVVFESKNQKLKNYFIKMNGVQRLTFIE